LQITARCFIKQALPLLSTLTAKHTSKFTILCSHTFPITNNVAGGDRLKFLKTLLLVY